ncbi:outer membrane beta-barrel protein [Rhodoblastus acidophilus]|uniref:outer membrane protein n=1 Tax=Candidatus Rhodoblastus alkanivorans TaxID=2954117 RepID=UPI001FAA1648|nr:outer membrane beta-barrel protein [Candidatus Rhodoblastus alkanivorans]MCI4680411.1 outer membrane beta-barrel protein [Candidatus Rhodoblastus alkanivorans]
MKRSKLVIQTYLALIGSAHAADLPSRYAAPVAPPPPAFLFQGAYVGAQVGALGFADRSNAIFTPTNGVFARHTSHGGSFTGGVLAGYDWHVGPVVFGLRGDVVGAHAVNAGIDPFGLGVTNRVDVQGALRGRVGLAFDRLLIFASGGLNVANVEHEYRSAFGSLRKNHITVGPTVGVGGEYAFDDRWRAHVEYRISDLGTRKEVSNPFNPLVQTRHDAATGAVTVGVSYRFGN